MLQKFVVLSIMLATLSTIVACDSGPKIETNAQAFVYAKAYIQTHCPWYLGKTDRYGQPLTEEAGRDGKGWYFHIGRGKDGPIEDVKFRIGKDGRLTGTFLEPCWTND